MIQRQETLNCKVVSTNDWKIKNLYDDHQILQQIGSGAYGRVFKAKKRQQGDNQLYAIKKMQKLKNPEQQAKYGFPITTFRQIKLLQTLNHTNILTIKQVLFQKVKVQTLEKPEQKTQKKRSGYYFRPSTVICLCLDLMSCDLNKIIEQERQNLSISKIQNILQQTLQGLKYIHSLNIAHRDLKPANLLISQQNIIKLADFGLAKKLKKLSTSTVVTPLYRAPQIFLGLKTYNTKIDIWSLGCLAAQLLLGRPLLGEAKVQTDLLKKIFELVGTPDVNDCQQQYSKGNYYNELKPQITLQPSIVNYLKQKCPRYEHEYNLLDLIQKMLKLNYHERLSAAQCLQHSFFEIQYLYEPLIQNYEDVLKKKIKL